MVKLLGDGELYLSNPRDFNDPFDCEIDFVLNNDINHLKSFFLNRGYPVKEVDEKFRKNEIKVIKEEILQLLKQTDATRIYCFSTDYDNPLMWAHYGQEHFGICIGFKTYTDNNVLNLNISDSQYSRPKQLGQKNLVPVYNVNYSKDKLLPVELHKGKQSNLFQHILTKADYWEYEKEKRIVFAKRALTKNPIHIKRTEFSEIIFGIRTPDEMRKKVINLVKDLPNIKFYSIKMRLNTYRLDRIEIIA